MDQLLGQQHAAGLGDGDGRGAQVLAELSPQLARADAGPGGQRVQVAVVQRAQLDQLQRARHAGGQPGAGPAAGAISGRQRRQGWKPASCAAAAVA